jgi:putative flippase GtrA
VSLARAQYERFRRLAYEFAKFGVIGVAGLFITNAVYDLFFLHLSVGPVTSTTIATIVAAICTYLGNRYWSFRTRQRTGVVRELVIFAALNGIGLLIQDAAVAFNYYLLQLGHNKLAGFIALNFGIALATLFRFWSYRRFVWVAPAASTAGHTGGRPPLGKLPQTAPDSLREGSLRHGWRWASLRAGMPGDQAQAHPGTVLALRHAFAYRPGSQPGDEGQPRSPAAGNEPQAHQPGRATGWPGPGPGHRGGDTPAPPARLRDPDQRPALLRAAGTHSHHADGRGRPRPRSPWPAPHWQEGAVMAQKSAPRPGHPAGPGTGPGRGADTAAAPAGLAPFDRRVILAGGAVFAVLMVLSPWYGFHRDELYFLDCARHLQASYVDQPVLTPLLAWVSLKMFGLSLTGLRLWPALAAAGTVVISGLTARELGGGRRPQLLAAVATATMPALLGADHLLGPTSLDILAWGGLALVVVRIGRTGQACWWLAAGVILGLGLANKHSIGFFALALVAGALLSGGWKMMANRWFAAGVAIAIAFTVPDLWWQAPHQWATITMTQALNHENGGLGHIGTWVAGQLIMVTLALVWVWLAGLRFLWRSRRPLWRALVWAYGLLFVFFAVTTGAKIYYLAGAYPALLAAGMVAIDAWLAVRPGRVRGLLLASAATTAAVLPLVLPVLPSADIGWEYTVNQENAESLGWPQLVQAVHKAWVSLPPAQRAHAVIFTANYGEASAINNLGRADGLPTAVSPDDSEWLLFSMSLPRITSVPGCAVSSVGFLWGSGIVSRRCGVSVGLAEASGWPGRPPRSTQVPRAYESR